MDGSASPFGMASANQTRWNYETARENDDERHICPLQLETVRRCVRLWSNPGDVILSPFMGIGTEGISQWSKVGGSLALNSKKVISTKRKEYPAPPSKRIAVCMIDRINAKHREISLIIAASWCLSAHAPQWAFNALRRLESYTMTKYEKLCITCHLSRCDGPNAKRCPQQSRRKLKPSRGAHTIGNGIRKRNGGYRPDTGRKFAGIGELDAKILE